jgi:hypothetical protein
MFTLLAKADPIGASGGDPAKLYELDTLVGNIIAGYKFITSEGDPKKVAEARSTLSLAIAGVVLLALALAILFIISQVTGNLELLNFNIYH